MASPQRDLTAHIATTLGLTEGLDAFVGEVRPPASGSAGVRQKAVFCRSVGNPPPSLVMGRNNDILVANVQVFIRGNRGQYADTETFARSVWQACHDVDVSGYFKVLVVESEPDDLGRDENDHPMWSLNARMWRQG
jgi:hypothetical protein